MRADAIRVAVRPRDVLECLDLATLVCGRRPLAVAIAIAIGSVPCIAVNRVLFAGVGDEVLFLALIVLGVEAAWAAVPLTLFLGQAVFSDRFSWRAAGRSLGGALPALIVFQGLLRGLCLATVFLVPIVLVGMYYLDQVILLERPPLSQVWRRRGSINRGKVARVMSLVLVDCLVLAVGTAVGADFLAAVARLWRGGGSAAAGDGSLVQAIMSWNGQVAFWSACGFLTIFRFFTYLDARIRREGWDVELRLRADDTYMGLPRTEARPPRTSGAARGALAAIAVMIGAMLAGGVRAADTADGRSAARRALERQSFPWYDADADRYRPLIDPPRRSAEAPTPAETAPRGGSGPGGGAGSGAGGRTSTGSPESAGAVPTPWRMPEMPVEATWWLLVALLVLAAVGLAIVVVRLGRGGGGAVETVDEEGPAEPAPEPLPAGIRLADGDLLARCTAEAARGDFAAAMLLFHAWLLVELHRHGVIALARGKTNGQYAAEVAGAAPELAGLFRASSGLFEDAFFGRLPVARADFLAVWERRDRLAARDFAGGPS